MSLSKNSRSKLMKEFDSCNSLIELFNIVRKGNQFTTLKIFVICIEIIISLIFSVLVVKKYDFGITLESLTSIGLSISIGLVALIIAGFSILVTALSNDKLYFLIISKEPYQTKTKNKKNLKSMYTKTIVNSIEPMLWFTVLAIFSCLFKVMYSIKEILKINIFIIFSLKIISLTILLLLIILALSSLLYFILNMYNFLMFIANFELLSRSAKNNSENGFEELLSKFEDELNKIND